MPFLKQNEFKVELLKDRGWTPTNVQSDGFFVRVACDYCGHKIIWNQHKWQHHHEFKCHREERWATQIAAWEKRQARWRNITPVGGDDEKQ